MKCIFKNQTNYYLIKNANNLEVAKKCDALSKYADKNAMSIGAKAMFLALDISANNNWYFSLQPLIPGKRNDKQSCSEKLILFEEKMDKLGLDWSRFDLENLIDSIK